MNDSSKVKYQTVEEYFSVKSNNDAENKKRRKMKKDLIINIGYSFKHIFKIRKNFICTYNTPICI